MLKHPFRLTLFCAFAAILLTNTPSPAVEAFKISSYGAGHQIWFEAEAFDERDPDDETSFALSDEPGAFGRSISSINNDHGATMIRYTFDISKAGGTGGDWYFWGRVINPSNNSDFMLVAGHPGDQVPFTLPVTGLTNDQRVFEETVGAAPDDWAWSGDSHNESHTKTLQAGENTMYILSRESGAFWDVLMWTDDPDYVPTDEDYENAAEPSKGSASIPIPSSGAEDVPRDVVLGWLPGVYAVTHDVYFGTAFEDVNDASRVDPRDVLVSQGQAEAAYAHDTILDFETTYHWRVDEVNDAPDNTIYKGQAWTFTTEPFAYVIESVSASTNAVSPGDQGPEKAVDGSGLNADGEHSFIQTDMWIATPDGNEAPYIQFEFDRLYKLHEMRVWNHNMGFEFMLGIGIKDATVEYSIDGVDWTVLADVELPQASGLATYTGVPIALDGVAAKYVRLMIHSNYRGGEGTDFGLSEVRFSYIPASAREPAPADGVTDVEVNATLSWRAARDATSYEVYLGPDPNMLEMVGTTTGTSYSPDLEYGATYAWKVTALSGAEIWDSAVWTLTTQDYAVIDDFEAYNDDMDAGTTVWQTWIDGTGDTANGGSFVGHDPSPFAELENVHGGAQAMPMYYAGALSETDYSIAPGQDWTARGTKSLSLWFYGAAGNTGQLYVKVNGVKVPYAGDPGDIAMSAWLPFNVDLTAIEGVQSVTSITIGIENATTDGLLLIDDVRLYPRLPEVIVPVEPDAGALLAHYEFEGNANDSSGNGLNGVLVDAETVATGAPDLGMGLLVHDGGYVDLGNPPAFDFATEDWAVAAWYKTAIDGEGDENKGVIACKGGDMAGGRRWSLIMSETTEGILTLVVDDDVTKYVVDTTTVTNDDEWHIVVAQRAGTDFQMYIDGQMEASATATEAYDLSGTAHHKAYIGITTSHADDTLIKSYEGLIDDVRIYHQALSDGEILWLKGETIPRPKPF